MLRHAGNTVIALVLLAGMEPASAQKIEGHPAVILSAGPVAAPQEPANLSPAERMQRRYPQPVKVGDLIGLPLLDSGDRTLGYVQSAVRTQDGKIKLIVPYGGFLGWGSRPVAVPIEVVGIAGRQLAVLDMTRAELDAAPSWSDPNSLSLPRADIIRIGLYRR
jgi:PRC-barrel domain